jgi:uncharacterized protein YjbJ (UPF0337 family)
MAMESTRPNRNWELGVVFFASAPFQNAVLRIWLGTLGTLTEDDWQMVAGKNDQLVGRIQERCGLAKAGAENSPDGWSHSLKEHARLTDSV